MLTGGIVLTVAGMIILQGIEDVLQGVVNVTSEVQGERRGINSRGTEVEPKITDSGKKTNTHYVHGDGDGKESAEQDERPGTGPEYVFSVGDDTHRVME